MSPVVKAVSQHQLYQTIVMEYKYSVMQKERGMGLGS